MIKCRTCSTYKQLEDYPTQRKTGFRGDPETVTRRLDCRVCIAAAARAYRTTHISKPKPKLDVSIPKMLWSAIGCRISDAKQRSVGDFNLTTEYMYKLYLQQEGRCALSGAALTIEKRTKDVLSIDQINAGGGYVEGNVQWVTWAVNRAKGDLSMPQFIELCAMVLARCNDYPSREYSQVAGSAQHL